MLSKGKLAFHGEKNDGVTVHWIMAMGVIALVALAAQDFVHRNLALDVMQALSEALVLAFILTLPYLVTIGITVLVVAYLGRDVRRSIFFLSIVLVPLVLFMAYAHFAMSQALVPLKLQFKERIVAVKTGSEVHRRYDIEDGGASPYADILEARDRYLREYGYLRVGTWQVGDGEGECGAVYLFMAGVWVKGHTDPKAESARGAF